MTTLFLHSMVVVGLATTLLESVGGMRWIDKGASMRPGRGRRRMSPPLAAIATLIGLLIIATRSPASYPGIDQGASSPALGAVIVGGVIVLLIAARSDTRGPSSRRHVIATLAGAISLLVGGFAVGHMAVLGGDAVSLGLASAAVITVIWVFLVVGILEICAALPLLAGLVSALVACSVLLPLPPWNSFAGHALGGAILGMLLGRMVGTRIAGRNRRLNPSEILFLGYIVAAATLALFLKSITLAGLILPLALLVVLVVLLVLQTFEKSLMLRAGPRE